LKQIFAQPTVKEQAVLLDNKGAHPIQTHPPGRHPP
jgi:hypothetical protein